MKLRYLGLLAIILLIPVCVWAWGLIGVGGGVPVAASGWQGRERKVEILIDETVCATGTLSDFPILLTAVVFQTGATEVIDTDEYTAQTDCGDWMIFDNGDSDDKKGYQTQGTNPVDVNTDRLPLEIVDCTMHSNPASATLEVWVGEVTLNCDDQNKDRSLVLYYDDAQGDETQPAANAAHGSEDVWNSGFIMVHHMTGANAAALDDSTSNSNDMTGDGGTVDYNQTGQAGQAVNFTAAGALEYITFPSQTLDGDAADASSASLWFNVDIWLPDNYSDRGDFLANGNVYQSYVGINDSPDLASENDNNEVYAWIVGSGVNLDTWYHTAIRANSGTTYIYLNGGSEDSRTPTVKDITLTEVSNSDADPDPGCDFDGLIDEIRISDTARSVQWFLAEYRDMNAPETYAQDQTPTAP